LALKLEFNFSQLAVYFYHFKPNYLAKYFPILVGDTVMEINFRVILTEDIDPDPEDIEKIGLFAYYVCT
jgi:hypothetical protein